MKWTVLMSAHTLGLAWPAMLYSAEAAAHRQDLPANVHKPPRPGARGLRPNPQTITPTHWHSEASTCLGCNCGGGPRRPAPAGVAPVAAVPLPYVALVKLQLHIWVSFRVMVWVLFQIGIYVLLPVHVEVAVVAVTGGRPGKGHPAACGLHQQLGTFRRQLRR